MYKESQKEFGIRLEVRAKNAVLINARERLGLSIKDVAKRIGVSYATYQRCETMGYYPSERIQKEICDFYRGSGLFLLEEDVFPGVLKLVKARKYIFEESIPQDKLISLSSIDQRLLPSVDVKEVYDNIYREELRGDVSNVLSTLSPKEEVIIKMRFGIGKKEMTLEEIAKEFSVTRETIRQIEVKVIKRLRHPFRRRRLKGLVE